MSFKVWLRQFFNQTDWQGLIALTYLIGTFIIAATHSYDPVSAALIGGLNLILGFYFGRKTREGSEHETEHS